MVLYLVYQLRWMFQSYANGNTLSLDFNLCLSQIAVDISGRMTCSQYNRAAILLIGYTAYDRITLQYQLRHFCLKVHFSATIDDGITHSLDYLGQTICSNMWMSVSQNSGRCAMLAEHIQNLFDISTLFRASIKFSVRVSTSTTFTKTVVALAVYLLGTTDVGQIFLTIVHIFTSFQHYGTISKLYQTKSSKQSARTSAYNYHLRFAFYIRVLRMLIYIIGRHFIHVCAYLKINKYLSLSCINTAFQYSHAIDSPYVQPVFISQIGFQSVFLRCHFGCYSYLIFFNHKIKNNPKFGCKVSDNSSNNTIFAERIESLIIKTKQK